MSRRGTAALIVALAAMVPVVSGCGVLGPSSVDASASASASRITTDDQDFPPGADAVLGACSGAGGRWTANGQVTNPTKNTYDYVITVDFYDAKGQQVDEVKAAPVKALVAGRGTTWKASSDGTFPTIATCRIGSVYRSLV